MSGGKFGNDKFEDSESVERWKMPEKWLEIGYGEDMLESRAFYELMQVYRFSDTMDAADIFEDVKEFIRLRYKDYPRV